MRGKKANEIFERLQEEKRKRVFDAAAAEFATNGYSGASMNRLARSAGISKGSIFQYFTSKSILFQFVISSAERRVKSYLKAIVAESAEKDFFSLVRALLFSGFDFIDDHPNLAGLYYKVLQSGDAPARRRIADRLNGKAQAFLRDLINEGVQRKDLRSDIDIDKAAFLMDSMFNNLLRAYYLEHIAPGLGIFKSTRPERTLWIEETISLLKHGLKRG